MRLLLVFLKEPVPGKVKTRLAADVGDDTAARYYKALVEVLLRQLHGLDNTRIRFCYAPDDADDAIRFWLLPEMKAVSGQADGLFHAPTSPTDQQNTQEIEFIAQGDGDLGDRMSRAFQRGFDDGFDEIAVIGTDCPDCGARWINTAFARMASCPDRHGVIGPCPDGGYYLLALQSPTPELFTDIPWSADDVLSATLASAAESNLIIEQLPELSDIDHLDDWQRLIKSPLGASINKALRESTKLRRDD